MFLITITPGQMGKAPELLIWDPSLPPSQLKGTYSTYLRHVHTITPLYTALLRVNCTVIVSHH